MKSEKNKPGTFLGGVRDSISRRRFLDASAPGFRAALLMINRNDAKLFCFAIDPINDVIRKSAERQAPISSKNTRSQLRISR
jgi:hypothetical protein